MEALFGGARSLIERTALGSRDRSREEQFWLLHDIHTLMERAALRQPLLVCLDDVHWADPACGFALRMLTQWLTTLPIAWIIAARPNQGAPQIRRALANWQQAGALTIRPRRLRPPQSLRSRPTWWGLPRRETSFEPWATCRATRSSLSIF